MARLGGCCATNGLLALQRIGGFSRLAYKCLSVVRRRAPVGHTRNPAEPPIKLLSLVQEEDQARSQFF